ncbi:hypothetical protein [Gemmatimonas groenlandica]|uniref:Uncharacterized protein n=1 Tax=Gemmatimonas groenlandica TaxID=2732249 RepID=A0A6M4IPX8_9BACT|nr:hypothetical protein [Gemmatimonas groenlandica]QJR36770.1 hypothetical protein HKW67_15225 [Gemmatimonas groenlandica]
MTELRRLALFTAVTIAGIIGTAIGALPGAAFGDIGFIGGGIAAGLLAVLVTVNLLARTRVALSDRRRHVTKGAVIGYLLFALFAVATMPTMIGPMIAVLFIGAGAVFGDHLAAESERALPAVDD